MKVLHDIDADRENMLFLPDEKAIVPYLHPAIAKALYGSIDRQHYNNSAGCRHGDHDRTKMLQKPLISVFVPEEELYDGVFLKPQYGRAVINSFVLASPVFYSRYGAYGSVEVCNDSSSVCTIQAVVRIPTSTVDFIGLRLDKNDGGNGELSSFDTFVKSYFGDWPATLDGKDPDLLNIEKLDVENMKEKLQGELPFFKDDKYFYVVLRDDDFNGLFVPFDEKPFGDEPVNARQWSGISSSSDIEKYKQLLPIHDRISPYIPIITDWLQTFDRGVDQVAGKSYTAEEMRESILQDYRTIEDGSRAPTPKPQKMKFRPPALPGASNEQLQIGSGNGF
jgi:hypothetical protein